MIRIVSPPRRVRSPPWRSASRGSSPSGPVSPELVDSPRTSVVITTELASVLAVPDVPGEQSLTYTEDGLLRYQFLLQNKTLESFFVRVKATFYDDQSIAVDDQGWTREPFGGQEVKTITKICGNKLGRRVRVQVQTAR
jgi:hypothetical protein